MFRCDKQLTIVHREPAAQASVSGDSYVCIPVTGSWYEKNKAAVTTTGLQTARFVQCRIPSTSPDLLSMVKRGDKMLKGTLSHADSAGFAALGRTHRAVTILDIHDNTDATNGHFYLEGSD